MSEESGAGATQGAGLLGLLRGVAATAVAVLRTRLELLSNELEEEQLRFAHLLLYAVLALFFLGLGVVALTLFVMLLFWETHRLVVVGLFAVLYIAAGIVAVLLLRAKTAARSRLFAASLAELQKDHEQLTSR